MYSNNNVYVDSTFPLENFDFSTVAVARANTLTRDRRQKVVLSESFRNRNNVIIWKRSKSRPAAIAITRPSDRNSPAVHVRHATTARNVFGNVFFFLSFLLTNNCFYGSGRIWRRRGVVVVEGEILIFITNAGRKRAGAWEKLSTTTAQTFGFATLQNRKSVLHAHSVSRNTLQILRRRGGGGVACAWKKGEKNSPV